MSQPDSAALGLAARTDYSREELIVICERAVVPMEKWRNRDSPHSQERLGLCWVLLKAGAPFSVHSLGPATGCHTNKRTIWLSISWHDFNDFEYGTTLGQNESFYLPTPVRLDEVQGDDWY